MEHSSNLTLEFFCKFVIFAASVNVGGEEVNEVERTLVLSNTAWMMVHHSSQSTGASIAAGLAWSVRTGLDPMA
jgi:hypothetical protein